MTTQVIQGGAYNKPQYIGEAGNTAHFDGYFYAAAASTGTDTEVDLFKIPQGAKVFRFSLAWTAHGTGGLATVGWKYADGSAGGSATAFLGSTDTSAIGSAEAVFIPQKLTALGSSGNSSGVFDKDVIVYAHLTGVAMLQATEIYAAAQGAYAGTR